MRAHCVALVSGKSVVSAAAVVAIGMLLGRVTGLVRELVLAARYGLTWEADVAMLTISLPDLLNTILIGGGVSAVLIPEFYRLCAEGGDVVANEMACQFLIAIGLASAVVALLVAVFADAVVGILAPGLMGPALANGITVVRIAAVALPFCAMTAVTSALLQARQRILSPAFGTLIFNTVLIVALSVVPSTYGCIWLGAAVVGATVIRMTAQIVEGWRAEVLRQGSHDALRFGRLHGEYLRRYFQAFAAVGFTIFIPVIARAFASHVEGGIACFNYGYKLVELPFGLLSAVLSMAVFPRISRLAQEGEQRESWPIISLATSMILLVTVPAIVFFLGAAEPVVALLFQRGKLGAEQVLEIAQLTRIAFFSLPALVLATHATSICHAYKDTGIPFVIGLVVATLCAITSSFFAGNLGALMASIAVLQWLQVGAMSVALRFRHGIHLGAFIESWRYVFGAIASAAMGLISWHFRPAGNGWLVATAVAFVMSTITCLTWFVLLRPTMLSRQASKSDGLPREPPLQRKIAA